MEKMKMPQICKCRIVNFRYNGGKRLIADELFDFGNELGLGANNALIDMANGIGKTVMVQLMLQPIIPNAKVSGRRIESYFQRPEDHCFVLLEWILDNSNDKLVTGIAMAAGEEIDMGTDNESSGGKGRRVRYYTFYTKESGSSEYDIAHLPLSKKEKGAFVPASFNDIRELAKRARNHIATYSADSNRDWGKKLAEFGILQMEWHTVMEKLNVKEGGISDFFEDFKDSDDLIDKLLIPTIERRSEASNSSNEDNSLETMLMNHSIQYGKQKENIAERDFYQEARNVLLNLKNEADSVANINYAFETVNSDIWGFYQALTHRREELQNKQVELRNKFDSIVEEERNIYWEKASAEYYAAENRFEKVKADYNAADEARQRCDNELVISEKELAKLDCAKILGEKLNAESKIKGLNDSISEKEGDEKTKNDIRNLQYSVAKQLSTAIPNKKEELNKCEKGLELNEKKLTEAVERENKLLEKQKSTQSRYDIINGKLELLQENNDKQINKLEIEAFRMLDGTFDELTLVNAQKKKCTEKESSEKEVEKAKIESQTLETKFSDLANSIRDCSGDLKVKDSKLSDLQKEIDDFYLIENKIKDIYGKYSSDYSQRATGALNNYIESEIRKAEAERNKITRKLENSNEELVAAKKGSLHIPTAAVVFLEEHSYEYDTCENYLLKQVRNEKISQEKCDDILAANAFIAYGLLMSEKQRDVLINSDLDYWLPFGVPIITYSEIEKVLSGENLNSRILALYSKKYFNDPSEFVFKLEQEINDLNNNLILIKSSINVYNSDLKEIVDFAEKEKKNKSRLDEKVSLTREKVLLEDKIKKLEEESIKCKIKQSEIKIKIDNLSNAIKDAKFWLKSFDELLAGLKEEKILNEESDELYSKLSELAIELASVKKAKNDCENKKHELIELQRLLKPEIQLMENAFGFVKNATEGDLIDGEWTSLYQELRTRLDSLNADIKQLRERIEEQNKFIENYNKQLNEKHNEYRISIEDYAEINYSDGKRDIAKELVSRNKRELEQSRDNLTFISGEKGKCEAAFETSRFKLKEFGNQALERDKVGSDFETRLKTKAIEKSKIKFEQEENDKTYSDTDKVWDYADRFLDGKPKPEKISVIDLKTINIRSEYNKLNKVYEKESDKLKEAERQLLISIQTKGSKISEQLSLLGDSICKLSYLITNNPDGDRFYTISERLDNNIENVDKSINRIKSDLEDFEKSKEDLIRQCVLQAKRVYEGLKDIVNASRIKLNDDVSKHILRIDLPEFDVEISRGNIASEITKVTEELAGKMANGEDRAKLRTQAGRMVSSNRLLRIFLSKEHISLEAYKVDANPKFSTYRQWENTQIQNSGAEKFLAYFAIIVSIINYNRTKAGGFNSKDQRSVLILDNPFGPISSPHVLQPMFDMAEKLKVQLICFSNITKTDITSRFKVVIKAIVKQIAASNSELLTHEGNERIEHGYYKREIF